MTRNHTLLFLPILTATTFFSSTTFAANLITNSDFESGTENWWSSASNGALQTREAIDGELCSTITNGGVDPWDLLLGTSGLDLVSGTEYEISFVAYADSPRSVRFKIGMNVSPYTDYFGHEVQVQTEPETYRVTYVNSVNDSAAQFQLQLGGSIGTVCFDDVSVAAISAAASDEPYVTPSPTGLALREYASGVVIGSALETGLFLDDQRQNSILAGEFASLTPGNAMKMSKLAPARGSYNWAIADSMVSFAEEHGMEVHGHPLVWHLQQPAWLEEGEFDRDEMLAIMYEHIDTVVGHYKGRVKYWDVVNEAIASGGTEEQPDYSTTDYRHTIWRDRIGPEYLELAFRRAREADPDAILLYNDYGNAEEGVLKADAVYELVRDLVEQGVPIDEVGFQLHLSVDEPIDFAKVRSNMARYAALGVGVQFTELDVRMRVPATAQDLEVQAAIYRDALSACIDAPNCDHFTTWGLTDNKSWVPDRFPGYGSAHLFDENYLPRPAYTALLELLQSGEVGEPAENEGEAPPVEDPMEQDPEMTSNPSTNDDPSCTMSQGSRGHANWSWLILAAAATLAAGRRRAARFEQRPRARAEAMTP